MTTPANLAMWNRLEVSDEKVQRAPDSLANRLARRSIFDPERGCWLWQGATTTRGYGLIWSQEAGRNVLVHKAAWEIENGPLPDGVKVCHQCDTPNCWKPDHLFAGTQADNITDMCSKGRHWSTRKLQCKRGHEFTPENTRIVRSGSRTYRRCVICLRQTTRDSTRRHRAKSLTETSNV